MIYKTKVLFGNLKKLTNDSDRLLICIQLDFKTPLQPENGRWYSREVANLERRDHREARRDNAIWEAGLRIPTKSHRSILFRRLWRNDARSSRLWLESMSGEVGGRKRNELEGERTLFISYSSNLLALSTYAVVFHLSRHHEVNRVRLFHGDDFIGCQWKAYRQTTIP